jgi:hypothetical protein
MFVYWRVTSKNEAFQAGKTGEQNAGCQPAKTWIQLQNQHKQRDFYCMWELKVAGQLQID